MDGGIDPLPKDCFSFSDRLFLFFEESEWRYKPLK